MLKPDSKPLWQQGPNHVVEFNVKLKFGFFQLFLRPTKEFYQEDDDSYCVGLLIKAVYKLDATRRLTRSMNTGFIEILNQLLKSGARMLALSICHSPLLTISGILVIIQHRLVKPCWIQRDSISRILEIPRYCYHCSSKNN